MTRAKPAFLISPRADPALLAAAVDAAADAVEETGVAEAEPVVDDAVVVLARVAKLLGAVAAALVVVDPVSAI